MTEEEHIRAIQELLVDMKEHLRQVRSINANAGRAAAANAAFLGLSELNVWHGKQTERMLEHYPSFGADVVIQGGGGR